MDITVTSTGKTFYQIDPAVAALLIEAFPASFERANPRPATPAEPQWGVGKTVSEFYYVICTRICDRQFYDGPPSGLVSHFQKLGLIVPDHIVERYKPLWKPRENEQAAYWAEYEVIQKGNK